MARDSADTDLVHRGIVPQQEHNGVATLRQSPEAVSGPGTGTRQIDGKRTVEAEPSHPPLCPPTRSRGWSVPREDTTFTLLEAHEWPSDGQEVAHSRFGVFDCSAFSAGLLRNLWESCQKRDDSRSSSNQCYGDRGIVDRPN